ncbi:uncharacterized protein EV422DRAFT_527795 [Fimicolochytrium jonesii]|uniref:uncharacterized protein n=1 Tax=Fimicolochytrium jonesii TaxID=1396493 RepID=UPI0022FE391B|nr:uncharacterized protein EV422DRAFT_527795 [Fimicolochytrium jonesii]KAI8821340.1 hypothetical protein EV422DRAFT_527795 [Fimicolochytrium jonesii]
MDSGRQSAAGVRSDGSGALPRLSPDGNIQSEDNARMEQSTSQTSYEAAFGSTRSGLPERPETALGYTDDHEGREFHLDLDMDDRNGYEDLIDRTEGEDGVYPDNNSAHFSMRGRERIYDVNLVTTHMPTYEPLLDEYLSDYFNSPGIRKHLQKLGLVDREGNITDNKEFKNKQVRLDREEYRHRILKKMEELEFDRQIEVAIRKQIEEDKSPRSQKLRRTVQHSHNSLPYADFLSQYPPTMTHTALLYAEKPASLTKAEEMLVAKLKQQSPRRLKALGLSPEQLAQKEMHARMAAKYDRKNLWLGGPAGSRQPPGRRLYVKQHSRKRSDHADRANGEADEESSEIGDRERPASRQSKNSKVVHDDLSGDEWEGVDGHEVTSHGPVVPPSLADHQKDQDSITNLFETAKQEYRSGKLRDVKAHVKAIWQKVGGKERALTTGSGSNLSKGSSENLSDTESAKAFKEGSPQKTAVKNLRASGRSTPSTPRHRSFRPKSARPTRESHFPIASDFSDFEGGSEGGYDSEEGEVFLSDDLDDVHALARVASAEPIVEENEAVAREVIEQSQVQETPEEKAAHQQEDEKRAARQHEEEEQAAQQREEDQAARQREQEETDAQADNESEADRGHEITQTEQRDEGDAHDKRRRASAVKVQALFRGFHTRKELEELAASLDEKEYASDFESNNDVSQTPVGEF